MTNPTTWNNKLQHDVMTIEVLANKYKIKLNPFKPEALLITRGVNRDCMFIFQNHIINNVNEYTQLRLTPCRVD